MATRRGARGAACATDQKTKGRAAAALGAARPRCAGERGAGWAEVPGSSRPVRPVVGRSSGTGGAGAATAAGGARRAASGAA